MKHWPVIGNEPLQQRLVDMLDRDCLPRAVAFSGPAGLGKEHVARWMIQRSICSVKSEKSERPCGHCRECRAFQAGHHQRIAIIEPTPDDPEASIGIEPVRRALASMQYAQAGASWLLIVHAERLTESAQNALLKFIEEPPSQTSVILVIDQIDRLLPTIRSRVANYRWSRVPERSMRERYPQATRDDLQEAAGRPLTLQRLLDDQHRNERRDQARRVVMAALSRQPVAYDEDQVRALVPLEEAVLRRKLLASIGLVLADEHVAHESTSDIMNLLERFQRRHISPTLATYSPTAYAYLHLI